MKATNVTDVRARIQDVGERPVVLTVSTATGEGMLLLTHDQAEVLLYDLHPAVHTLRGIAKKPRLSERPSRVWKALRGR